jgi:hypothetical protein
VKDGEKGVSKNKKMDGSGIGGSRYPEYDPRTAVVVGTELDGG